jgi:glutathione S-transferase
MSTTQTQEAYDKAFGSLREVLARYEPVVVGPFFAGEKMGIVDVAIAPVFHRMKILEAHSTARFFAAVPKVDAWASQLAARPSVVEGVRAGFEEEFMGLIRMKAGVLAKLISAPSGA